MGRFAQLVVKAAQAALGQLTRSPARTVRRTGPVGPSGNPSAAPSPGQRGATATDDADPGVFAAAAFDYAPNPDGDPDPGEVVWTWVPYEEHDGRGKDRPVLLVARTSGDGLLGVQLTSKAHNGADYLPVGSGGWDAEGRDSWAKLDRVLLVHPDGMRREGTALSRSAFDQVTVRLSARWSR
ncbi:MAG: type II toxin-antitoxin system PemK/MazF family toxin [Nakamurella sp.]